MAAPLTTSATAQFPARTPPAAPAPTPPADRAEIPAAPEKSTDTAILAAAEALRDNWERAKQNLRHEFGDLTEDDLLYPADQEDLLVDRIAQKTGRSGAEIRAKLHENARLAQG